MRATLPIPPPEPVLVSFRSRERQIRKSGAPRPKLRSQPRSPLLWAALAFSSGLLVGLHAWRPPTWWMVAAVSFTLAGIFYIRRRTWAALACALAVLFVSGALTAQLRTSRPLTADPFLFLPEKETVSMIGHVTRETEIQEDVPGEWKQRLDLEIESVHRGNQTQNMKAGLRLSVYGKSPLPLSEPTKAVHEFRYGERLKFSFVPRKPRNYRNPGSFDYEGYLSEQNISLLGSVKSDQISLLPGFVGNRIELWRTQAHHSVIHKVHQLWPAPQAALMDAMVIGEDAFLRRATRTDFQRSGTYHVLVVSGMNVTILAMVIFWTLKRLRIADLVAGMITVALIFAYAFLTDEGSPVWRATLMLALYVGARLFYREKSMLNAIGAAALGIQVYDPVALFGASFQLTFLCVLLIAGIASPILQRTLLPYSRGLRQLDAISYDAYLKPKVAQFRLDLRMIATRLQRFVAGRTFPWLLRAGTRTGLAVGEVLFLSAVMQLGLALPMAYCFHRVTVMGMPANLLVVPLTELLMPASIAAIALGYISLTLAKLPAMIAQLALTGIAGTVRSLGGLRIADTRVATPETAVIVVTLAVIVLAMILARRRLLFALAGVLALAGSAFWLCYIPTRPHLRSGVLEVTAIDVGQGDSLLVVSPDGRTLLIDAGGLPYWSHSELDMGEDVVSPYLWSRGIQRLDAVAITHPHSDHIGGMPAILSNFQPRELWMGSGASNNELEALIQKANIFKIRVLTHSAGDEFGFGQTSIRVLSPIPRFYEKENRSHLQNDESLALKISYGATSALLEGDAENKTESRIAHEEPAADLLKVAHHGSQSSTRPDLLSAVHPHFAVISVGAGNVYGHPRREVLDRLTAAKVITYRTDQNGAVTFYLDGTKVTPEVIALH